MTDLDRVVGGLRAARQGSSHLDGPLRRILPSRKPLANVVDSTLMALFPNHFGPPELVTRDVDAYVREILARALGLLVDEVRHELRWAARGGETDADLDRRAADVVNGFAEALPGLRSLMESDLVAAYHGDPAAGSLDEVLICYPGVRAAILHRLAHALSGLGAPLIARVIAEMAHSSTGVDIHPSARIGGSFFIDHGTGVVIGETAVIGERVRLYQAVTLGAKRFDVDEHGALVKGTPRHPVVEDDVVIYAGATILGRITVGRGSVIGGNVWLTRSVPPGSHITQAQVRTEAFEAGAGI
jgi:serine O-acetyltransferase